MQPMRIRFAATVAIALLLPINTRALQSEMPELTSYMGIRFQNTTLQALTEQFGPSVLFDPPGEVLLPDEVCYHVDGQLEAMFFVEHYGRNQSASTVVGVAISRHASSSHDVGSRTATATCAVPKVPLSGCLGRLCLGDSIEHVKQILSKEMTYSGSYEWTYDVHLSPGDLVVGAFSDATKGDTVPDWMYPSHIVRVEVSNGVVTMIYVAIDVDMA